MHLYLGFRARSPSPNPDESLSSAGNTPTSANGKVDFCEYVIEEILVTEQQYVRDLEDIVLVSSKHSHNAFYHRISQMNSAKTIMDSVT